MLVICNTSNLSSCAALLSGFWVSLDRQYLMTWNWHLWTIMPGNRSLRALSIPLWPSQTMAKGICFKLPKNVVQLALFSRWVKLQKTTPSKVLAIKTAASLWTYLPSMTRAWLLISICFGLGSVLQSGENHWYRVWRVTLYFWPNSVREYFPKIHFLNNFWRLMEEISVRFLVFELPQLGQRYRWEPLLFLPHFWRL